MSMRTARSFFFSGLLVAAAAIVPACSGNGDPTGQGGSAASNTAGAGTGTAGSGAVSSGGSGGSGASATGGATTGTTTGGFGGFIEVACVNQTYQCGDTIDNDGDGLTDWTDPDCLGPCDNTEDSYYGGIPGQSGPNCDVDCYWDSNSGSGNDECYWNHKCDPNEADDPGHPEPNTKCKYDQNTNVSGTDLTCDELLMMQPEVCAKVCGPLTPNGCDCFGCCELPAGSGKYIWLGSEDEATGEGSCTVEFINDVDKCEPCIPVPSCLNGCEKCELCLGKDELPPECLPGGDGGGGAGMGGAGMGGGGTGQCPPGIQACGLPGQALCPADYYCITGCCQPIEGPR
jgi:hypothetical protein